MKYFNEDGFLIIFVIFITSILLLMGLSALVLTQNDYEMKQISSRAKKNFYIAEAATEEANTLIYSHIADALNYSYENLESTSDPVNNKIDLDYKKKQFNSLYKSYMNTLEDRLEHLDSYNLKTKDNLEFTMQVELVYSDTLLKENSEEIEYVEGFIMNILAVCNNEGIKECIEVKYHIETPEYMSSSKVKDIVFRKSWVNSQW